MFISNEEKKMCAYPDCPNPACSRGKRKTEQGRAFSKWCGSHRMGKKKKERHALTS